NEVSVRAERPEPAVLHRGGGTGTGVVGAGVLAHLADLDRPQLFAVLDREGVDIFVAARAAHDEEPAADHGGGSVAATEALDRPEQFRPLPGPGGEQPLFV